MDNTCVVCRKLEIKIVWVVCHSSQSDFRFLSYDIHVHEHTYSRRVLLRVQMLRLGCVF